MYLRKLITPNDFLKLFSIYFKQRIHQSYEFVALKAGKFNLSHELLMHVSPGAVRITLMQIIEFRLFVQNCGNKIGRAKWVLHRYRG